uniref:mitogen-activated protein kinase kinase n=1 Tax=Malurus cyaneus samueli TaxID=2593467 RepID=A0A8C5X8V5_9PASS
MLWLLCGPSGAMDSQALVIRIKIPDGVAVDWTVHSAPQLLFRDVLDVIGQVLPDATTTAFEYEDEDGDRITVRSDEEMKAMLSYYYSTVMEQQVNGQLTEPLQIYPRACKPPGKRNIHGLKVRISIIVSGKLDGFMNEQDIRYRDILGHGNGGTVVKGLTYLWSLKILHRDVKPSNMLVNTRGQVKLCDFGVSTQLVNSIAKTYVGTNAYMAPERISGEQYGIHSDVWSLGISFMEVRRPLQLLQCIVDEESPVLPAGEFSEPFVHFITQCMKKQPKERPAPEDLMGHPFIVQYNDGNAEVVSMWVCRMLEERRSQGPQ